MKSFRLYKNCHGIWQISVNWSGWSGGLALPSYEIARQALRHLLHLAGIINARGLKGSSLMRTMLDVWQGQWRLNAR